MLKRTQQEIKARYESRAGEQKFFEGGEYLRFLTWESAYPYLSADAEEKYWNVTKDDPIKLAEKEMKLAWADVGDGVDVPDRIQRIMAWIWLAKEIKLLTKVEKEYAQASSDYAEAILKMICEHFSWVVEKGKESTSRADR